MINCTHVEGENKAKIIVYSLSTCVWCKRLKKLLVDMNIAFDFVDVDNLTGEDEKEAEIEVKKWNKNETYPTMIINNEKCFLGLDLDEITEAFK